MQKMLNLLHPAAYPNGRRNNGRIALVQTHDGKWDEKLYRRNAFFKACAGLRPDIQDSYYSINSFGQRRRTESLVSLNSVYVDLDLHGLFIQPEFVLNEVRQLSGVSFPSPSMVFHSGRGLWLMWLLEPLPPQALDKWARITDYLIKSLAHLGADKKVRDATRVMRLPNTINSKCSKLTYCNVLDPKPMRSEAFNAFLPALPQKRLAFPKQRTTTHHKLFSPYSLAWTIIDDLETLAQMRERSLKGHRELFLFIWRNCLAQTNTDPDISAHILKTKALKYLGTEPLSDREWLRSTMSPYRVEFESYNGTSITGYKLTHQWIIESLNITPAEQEKMKTLIGTEEKYRRKNNKRSDTTRIEYLEAAQNLKEKIIRLKDENPKATVRQIAEWANTSRSSVCRALKT